MFQPRWCDTDTMYVSLESRCRQVWSHFLYSGCWTRGHINASVAPQLWLLLGFSCHLDVPVAWTLLHCTMGIIKWLPYTRRDGGKVYRSHGTHGIVVSPQTHRSCLTFLLKCGFVSVSLVICECFPVHVVKWGNCSRIFCHCPSLWLQPASCAETCCCGW